MYKNIIMYDKRGDFMKTKLMLIAVLFAALQLQSGAAVTIDQTTSKDFLINSGYSEALSESVNLGKAWATGQEYYTDAEKNYKNSSGFARFWKKTYQYFDPAAEDFSFFHHNISPTPSVDDL